MKQRSKKTFNTICLAFVVVVMTACGGSGGTSSSGAPVADGAGLSVANAPVSVEGSFIAINDLPQATITNGALGVSWVEQNSTHTEAVGLKIDLTTGVVLVIYNVVDSNGVTVTGNEFWACDDHISSIAPCDGTTVDQSTGVVTFDNQVLVTGNGSSAAPVTINGTLEYMPPG